jgi:hypothetical protein
MKPWHCLLTVWIAAALPLPAQPGCPVLPAQAGFLLDGRADDWPAEACTDPKRGVRYAMSRDSAFARLLIRIPNDQLQHQILMCGMTLWLAPGQGIRFPIGLPASQQPSDTYTLQYYREQLAQDLGPLLRDQPYAELTGFYGRKEPPVLADARNPGGMSLALGQEGTDLLLEAELPLDGFPMLAAARLRLELETGRLGRPSDLRGYDAAGLNTGPVPTRLDLAESAARQRRLDQYSQFTTPARIKLQFRAE